MDYVARWCFRLSGKFWGKTPSLFPLDEVLPVIPAEWSLRLALWTYFVWSVRERQLVDECPLVTRRVRLLSPQPEAVFTLRVELYSRHRNVVVLQRYSGPGTPTEDMLHCRLEPVFRPNGGDFCLSVFTLPLLIGRKDKKTSGLLFNHWSIRMLWFPGSQRCANRCCWGSWSLNASFLFLQLSLLTRLDRSQRNASPAPRGGSCII